MSEEELTVTAPSLTGPVALPALPPPTKPLVYAPWRSASANNPPPSESFNEALLRSVLSIQSISHNDGRMRAYLTAMVKMIEPEAEVWEDYGNLYVVKGDADLYPAVVAHMDTVHSIVPDNQFTIYYLGDLLFAHNEVMNRHTGIGGDDKVGIFLALECLRLLPEIKIAFFRDEEVGCLGSRLADLSFFDDCCFVLQGDRRGNDDFVRRASGIDLATKQFEEAVKPILDRHGFSPCSFGASTDVVAMRSVGLELCVANVSCGYFNPHTSGEYVVMGDVERTLNLFLDLFDELGGVAWPHPKPEPEPVKVVVHDNWKRKNWDAKGKDDAADGKWERALSLARQSVAPGFCEWCLRPLADPCKDCQAADDIIDCPFLPYPTEAEMDEWEAKYGKDDILDRLDRFDDEQADRLLALEDAPMPLTAPNECPVCLERGVLQFDEEYGEYFCCSCGVYLPTQRGDES